ncbi:carbamate kinase [Listeria ilorinensis]|uniref:carbamate kinase n=1 Tax=Listeria ilorinensis TaxID=2867439 RepID=UPI001EF5D924|nr:carbamate kinase [Listeria ilorinensis]
MTKRKIVVALGGNAILSDDASANAQQEALKKTARHLAAFIKNGDELIISHGNGPQVGNLLLQQEAGNSLKNPAMPLDTCVAMTQGSIGYWLQKALDEVLIEEGIQKEAIALVTQVVVSPDDPAFKEPTKPIGPFLTKEEADAETALSGSVFKEDAGRGYRKVVPSPKPISIKEHQVIRTLVESGVIVVAAGGGGISVVEEAGQLRGVEAVIDKDFASEKLAELIDADLLLILTAVDHVAIHFNQPDEKKLGHVTVSEIEGYMEAGEFAKGSMLPKIEAAKAFVEFKPEAKAIITSLENICQLIEEEAGTVLTMQ